MSDPICGALGRSRWPRGASVVLVGLAALGCAGCDSGAPGGSGAGDGSRPVAVRGPVDLAGQSVDPLADAAAKLTVLIFVRTDCPISNRLAPEIQRIAADFRPRGVKLWLVYPDPDETPAMIRRHLEAYGYHDAAIRDPDHTLVQRCGVAVTPEAVVFVNGDEERRVYRGRINDRFVDFGVTRPAPTREDLREALNQALRGEPVAVAQTDAVGCTIPPLP